MDLPAYARCHFKVTLKTFWAKPQSALWVRRAVSEGLKLRLFGQRQRAALPADSAGSIKLGGRFSESCGVPYSHSNAARNKIATMFFVIPV